MAIREELRKSGRQVFGPLVGMLLIGYFAFHAIEGERGVRSWSEFDRRIAEAEDILGGLRGERDGLDRRVAMLYRDSLEPDLLDGRARVLLDMIGTDEMIIPLVGRAAPSPVVGASASTR